MEEELTANTAKNKVEYIKPYQWKKGESGNPSGRPKGSLKDYVRQKLATMSDEEKNKFLKGISKEVVWKMGEGNPSNELTGKDGKDLIPEPSEAIRQLAAKLLDAQHDNS